MDIEDAFTPEAMAAAGVEIGGEHEPEIHAMAQELARNTEVDLDTDSENIAVYMFYAGQTYGASNLRLSVPMSPHLIGEFLQFLTTEH